MYFLLAEAIAKSISDSTSATFTEALSSIELPKKEFGDISSTISFHLSKKQKKSPQLLAKDVAGSLVLPDWIEKAEVQGPYINFFLSDKFFASLLEHVFSLGHNFGRGQKKDGKVIVEFPSVNPNKPWHVGHLRNALLGDSVARTLEFAGYEVERIDYIDDLGLQVAQSFWGYKNLASKPTGKLDLWLGQQYVEVAKLFESDKQTEVQVRVLLKKIEEGIQPEASECRALVEKCVSAQYETAFKFGIYHDALVFESDIVKTLFAEGISLLKQNGAIAYEKEGKNAGCWVAKLASCDFEALESPDKVLIRSDGTATYTGKDVIFQLWKFGLLKNDFLYSDFLVQPNGKICKMTSSKGTKANFGKASRVINVIGTEQIYPQKVIREVLRLLGYQKQAENSIHLAYEHVWLEDRHFSGREGSWIGYTADELYDEGVKRAAEKIKPQLPSEEKLKIASSVSCGAIRFSFLRPTPEKKIVFKWEEALSLEGDSAPYVMYAHARAYKIFEKGGQGKASPLPFSQHERHLLKQIMLFEKIVQDSAAQLRPHLLVDYCIELATLYNKFYSTCPILSCQDDALRQNRLAINFAAMTCISNALSIIGIDAPKTM
ncbi:MAG: arginine--tRNA ligase [Candidatus Micrarchaeota archaeon]|nr:arginine--tRNA ligase [Candidatus Micrarchaeota archaeon]